MSYIEKIREALSFGARTGAPDLMKAIYQLEPEGPEYEVDDGPKIIERDCSRCPDSFLVSERHTHSIPADSLFNICPACVEKMIAEPEGAPMSSDEAEIAQRMLDELRGGMHGTQSDPE